MSLNIINEFQIITKPQQGDNVIQYLDGRGFINRRDTETGITVYPLQTNPFNLRDAQNLQDVVQQYSMLNTNERINKALAAEAKPK